MSLPLKGVKIVSIEQFGAGPYGTMFLADLGAEVIKIENPSTGGDPARVGDHHKLGFADSQYFQTWNTNKRSVLLDIKSVRGRQDFEDLIRDADAVVNNLRGDQPKKLGITYVELSKINPAIVCLHISAYGRDNERAARPGYDFLMQAEAGLMSLTGDPDRSPARFGPSIIDYMTGMTGMTGLLSAIISSRTTGLGCDVDTSLYEVALHQLGYAGTWYLNDGEITGRLARSSHFSVSPVQTFRASDGWFFMMCMTDKFWTLMAELIGHPELVADPAYRTLNERFQNRDQLTETLDAIFREKPTKYWIDHLGQALPVGPVYDVAQALDNPFTREIGMIQDVPHPERPDLRLIANPLRINALRLPQVVCSALGADNTALLGKSDSDGESKVKRPRPS
ncbi:CoA transferase [Aminobacter sp. MSH1]|uniref:CaiB/BaiF CoA transferase family protein n=1 Tax=Aminobacter sp. MSH1 TaxID=374606 RepID=UPI000D3A6C9F|nr:CoA transferase [Aminobacter sp. MSH1]